MAEMLAKLAAAAGRGDAQAQFHLGQCYHTGAGGVAPDPAIALEWYRRAAAAGHARASLVLGTLHHQGLLGLPVGLAEAHRWYEAAAASEPTAAFNAGLLCRQGGWEGAPTAAGSDAGDAAAARWFRVAAEHGFAPAQYALGCALEEGRGVDVDDAEAEAWLAKAAAQVRNVRKQRSAKKCAA